MDEAWLGVKSLELKTARFTGYRPAFSNARVMRILVSASHVPLMYARMTVNQFMSMCCLR